MKTNGAVGETSDAIAVIDNSMTGGDCFHDGG
jgi:hypothetical protein